MRFIFLTLFLTVAGITPALAKESSFQRSCNNVSLQVEHHGAWIHAQCGDGQGGYIQTQIEIMGIHNISGGLMVQENQSSSFQRSCTDTYLEWDDHAVHLVTTCKDGNGGYRSSSISIRDIHNKNGWLVRGW